ncbi:MAG TPA: hypothetical protein VHN36_12700, partial [Ilumatobacteraceae bacterium]|nr:hypothetical protein [Ilumatobacteraceae bacterium]
MTIRSTTTDPRGATLLADAHALGLTGISSIDVADLVFVVGGTDRVELVDLLVDPLLQTGEWTIPTARAIETTRLPGVTDASAQAVALAAETIGSPITAVATGTRYEVHGDAGVGPGLAVDEGRLDRPHRPSFDHGVGQEPAGENRHRVVVGVAMHL